MHTIIYIGGYGRSGSTILERYICNEYSAVGVGEISLLFNVSGNDICSCGRAAAICDFWSPILKHSTGEIIDAVIRHVNKNNLAIVDSSKTAGIARYGALNRHRYGSRFLFIHLQRDLFDTMASIAKGRNRSLEMGRRDFKAFILVRGFVGYLMAHYRAYVISMEVPSVTLDFHMFSRCPTIVNDTLAAFLTPGSGEFHSLRGNRHRKMQFSGVVAGKKATIGRTTRFVLKMIKWGALANATIRSKISRSPGI